jgi:hypothetical protein
MNDKMKTERLTPLDTKSFQSQKAVVRLFIKGNLYAGILHGFLTKDEPWHMRIDPYGRFFHDLPIDAYDPGDVLVNDDCKPIVGSFIENGQAFRIADPQKIISPKSPSGILRIKLDDGVMILSHRQSDLDAVSHLLEATKATLLEPH